jgi:ubiquinone/menaquinone biosynthesis C-methylase UbiE
MPIYEVGAKVFGIDYSDSLIKLAKRAMPLGEFKVAEANCIPFDNEQFEVVLSHSIFQYFPSIKYAQEVISEISRVLAKGGKAAILDINDAQKKEQFFEIRMGKIGKEQYKEKYDAYPHRFYQKEWFLDSFNDLGLKASIEDQAIEAYGNSKFRFNVYIES